MRKLTTHFCPSVGVKYLIKNVLSGETVIARVAGKNDAEFYPVRSTKNTPPGEEFFKVILDKKSITFKNSLNYQKCMSSDNLWEFIGIRPDGTSIAKVKKNIATVKTDDIEFISQKYMTQKGIV